MLNFALSTLGLLGLSAPLSAPSFAEAWYREVFEGNVAAAAKEYETLYLAQPSERLRPEAQQRAAFRAGLCFERLGVLQSAGPAYAAALKVPAPSAAARGQESGTEEGSWRLSGERPSMEIAREAAFRLRSLGLESPSGSTGPWDGGATAVTPDVALDIAVDVTVDVAIQAAVDDLRSVEKGRALALSGLEAALAVRRQKVAERRDLIARLEARGILLSFTPEAAVSGFSGLAGATGDAAAAALREAMPVDADLHHVQGELRERLLDATLEAIRSGNELRASSEIPLLSALSVVGPNAVDFPSRVASLKGLLQSGGQSAQAAERLILDLEIERKTLTCREIHLRLKEARDEERGGRKDHAIVPLDRVRDLLDWSGPAVRDDAEVSTLARQAASRYLVLAKSRDEMEVLARLWRQVRSQADRMVRLAGELLETASEEGRLRGPVIVGGRMDAVDACRGEAQRLLSVAQTQVRSPAAPLGAERALRDGLLILDWVPAADAGSSLRGAMESLLKDATAAPAESPTAKKQELKDTKSP